MQLHGGVGILKQLKTPTMSLAVIDRIRHVCCVE